MLTDDTRVNGVPTLFVTGASGFIGRHLLARIAAHPDVAAIALTRRAVPDLAANIRQVRADLFEPDRYRTALAQSNVVVHLAAAVGRAPPAEYYRVNQEGTSLLLRECAAAGVRRFLFVSSIATQYADIAHYHYAIAKRRAEAAVLASGLRTSIVRPTIVLGPGSAIGRRLRALAALPIIPVFGDGRARVQPVHVDDVAAVLLALVLDDRLDNVAVDVGGPDIVTMEVLLRRIHRGIRGRDGRVVHLPVHAIRTVLASLEKLSPVLAPVPPGPLTAFCNDGVAKDDARAFAPAHTFVPLDVMIEQLVAHA